jgi:Domain of unknown function (DUF4160)
MFFDDHGPAHFHARHAQGSAKVQFDSLEVIDSSLPRRQLRWSCTRASCARTGVAPAPVRHFSRSRRFDDRLTPDITEAAVVRHGVLRLRFADGLTGEVDVLDRMRGPVFDQARSPGGFRQSQG